VAGIVIFFILPAKQLPVTVERRGNFRLRRPSLRASDYLHMKTAVPSPVTGAAGTRRRLIEAAGRVYARDGLTGATTRAIAEEAGVNEVTLFRHFKTKDRLLAAVVGENFGEKPPATAGFVPPPPTADLQADLAALVRGYAELLQSNWPLVRTMLGEMHHHLSESAERQVFRAIFLPLKEAALRRLELAIERGEIRSGHRADLLADLLFGMIFSNVLRRSIPQLKIDYSVAAYLEAAVTLFLEGVAAAPRRA
jgi:AcrR family transcriptional regulator